MQAHRNAISITMMDEGFSHSESRGLLSGQENGDLIFTCDSSELNHSKPNSPDQILFSGDPPVHKDTSPPPEVFRINLGNLEQPRQIMLMIILMFGVALLGVWADKHYDCNAPFDKNMAFCVRLGTLSLFYSLSIYGITQTRDSIFSWPHPAVWRVLHAAAVVYMLTLTLLVIVPTRFGLIYTRSLSANFPPGCQTIVQTLQILKCNTSSGTLIGGWKPLLLWCDETNWLLVLRFPILATLGYCAFHEWRYYKMKRTKRLGGMFFLLTVILPLEFVTGVKFGREAYQEAVLSIKV